MRILLTGARGFTGRHFTRIAAAAGHEVIPLEADLCDAQAVAAGVDAARADAVLHLAGLAFVARQDERGFYDVNLFGSLNLVQALARSPVRPNKVVLASSANVYGNCEASPIPETQAPAPVNHYAMSKLAMEHMAAADADGLPLVITRPFNYTGPGQAPEFVIPKLVEHFRSRSPVIALGNIDVEREYNDVRFTCAALLALLAPATPAGTYNLCTGVPHSLRSVIALLERLTGHHARIEVDPAFVRPHEIHRLCGDPSRLQAACADLPVFHLEQTLSWMLEQPA